MVAVLFARKDSVYKTFPDCDVFDVDRNALNYSGGRPIVAHPPCRAWGQLAHMANPRPGERELALWAVDMVRLYGGVLEHPRASRLWKEKPLPKVGDIDAWGGFTLKVNQFDWGHKAEKATNLYICGCVPNDVPELPQRTGRPTHVIASSSARQHRGHPCFRPEVTRREREATPPAFAEWLVELAGLCRAPIEDLC
jgi:hypothetical protein